MSHGCKIAKVNTPSIELGGRYQSTWRWPARNVEDHPPPNLISQTKSQGHMVMAQTVTGRDTRRLVSSNCTAHPYQQNQRHQEPSRRGGGSIPSVRRRPNPGRCT
jgi:hypothetical protein